MKVSIIASAAVAAILSSTGVIAQDDGDCNPCPGGITVDPDTETVPGRTCGGLEDDTNGIPATTNVCDRITADAIKFCCPPDLIPIVPEPEPATPCSVCPDGIPDENLDIPTVQGKTCEDLLTDAPRQIEGSGICSAMKNSEDICCPFVATTVAATTPAVVTTAVVATVEAIDDIATTPKPTMPPTNKPTMGPTSRDQLFGNILQTPTNTLDDVKSPTRTPTTTTINPTYSPTTFPPTYTPTYNELAGRGKAPPDWILPGDELNSQSGALSMGISSRLGLVATLFVGACGILFA